VFLVCQLTLPTAIACLRILARASHIGLCQRRYGGCPPITYTLDALQGFGNTIRPTRPDPHMRLPGRRATESGGAPVTKSADTMSRD